MTTLQSILPLLLHRTWLATIDSKDAYFHIDIVPEHRKSLWFAVGDTHLQYKSLPFGINTAPRVLTKTMVVIAAYLRLQGILIFPYIDDWLIVADSENQLERNLNVILHLLSNLGLQLNHNKSLLIPTQRVQFIGAILDTRLVKAFLPQDSARTLTALASQVHTQPKSTAPLIHKLLDHMAATTVILHFAKLHMHPLQLWFLRTFHPVSHPQNLKLTPPHRVCTWWMNIDSLCQGVQFLPPNPSISIMTDASLQGWGVHLGTLSVGDRLPLSPNLQHINVLELSAIFLALFTFLLMVQGSVVSIFTDNSTALSYINRQWISRTLCRLALQLWN